MDQIEELRLIAAWLTEEGCVTGSKEAQLCALWRALQHTKDHLIKVTNNLETQRSQHCGEMAEVRKSLEQIRIFTQHKDVLAQEIQDENDQLKNQLKRLISLQDAQISEVAKMLHQQGLTELMHSSPSEQVAYLLVERASLLETSENPTKPKLDESSSHLQVTEALMLNTSGRQTGHKVVLRHAQSSWRRLFGLHKASQSKHTFIPTQVRHAADQSSLEKQCSRLERDLEEGSRRLAMAHNEIRHLTDELESAHMTQRTYEPELQSAQQEVEQLRHQVEKLKTYEMVELRKVKGANDHLDLEIRALRSRVRCLDAEKTSLQEKVASLQEKVKELQSALQEQQIPTVQVGVQTTEKTRVERLKSFLQEHGQQLLVTQAQAQREDELAKMHSLQQLWDDSHPGTITNLSANMCIKDSSFQNHILCTEPCEDTPSHLEDAVMTELHKGNSLEEQEGAGYKEAVSTLKKEICETLRCLNKEQSKYFEMRERHRVKLCRAKQKFADMTDCYNKKIKHLERELSLCSHSLLKKKELMQNMNEENEKLLFERSRLLLKLDEEEHNKKATQLSSLLSKHRLQFLEEENMKLGNQVSHQSNQLAVLQRCLKKVQLLPFAEEVKKSLNQQLFFTPPPEQTLSGMQLTQRSSLDGDRNGDDTLTGGTSSSGSCSLGPLCRSAEMGYLNVTTQSHTDSSSHQVAHSFDDSLPT
ncbi:coiled-coil domain-containing protein 30 isoform X2 [Gouania willdenowi]|uniref:coiled-coil domain-containing protein 30 isoform X2 n=1 Tax=Gouania willdenowi TaxID=441366 RepID=UPI001056A409|nr:coiled-coil domain-containing protein 30-like isoform X2 [Gouania willdenowi]